MYSPGADDMTMTKETTTVCIIYGVYCKNPTGKLLLIEAERCLLTSGILVNVGSVNGAKNI